jgi:hypothetical protein
MPTEKQRGNMQSISKGQSHLSITGGLKGGSYGVNKSHKVCHQPGDMS